MVRYHGYYSGICRGKRNKQNQDGLASSRASRGSCTKEKLSGEVGQADSTSYEVDPLVCPKCNGRIRIIELMEEREVIKKILARLGL